MRATLALNGLMIMMIIMIIIMIFTFVSLHILSFDKSIRKKKEKLKDGL